MCSDRVASDRHAVVNVCKRQVLKCMVRPTTVAKIQYPADNQGNAHGRSTCRA
jgi:hypothetical protein